jgi:hypothetical protein
MNVNWKVLTVIIIIVLIGTFIYAWRKQDKIEDIRQFGGPAGGMIVLVR